MDIQRNGEELYLATPEMKETADQYYAGVRKVSFVQLPLLSVNAENAEETIFGNFEKLYLSNYSSQHQLLTIIVITMKYDWVSLHW